MAKASDNVFPRVIAGLNTTDQAAPSDSSWRIYAKPGGIYARSSNAVVGPFAAASAASTAGTLIGLTAYKPGSDTSIGSSVSSTSADLDGTNMICTFTAPASGNVLVRFTAMVAGPASGAIYWQVRESTSVLIDALVDQDSNLGRRRACSFYLTGISAGSHTYKWGIRTSAATHTVYGGPTFGQAVIEVFAAP